MNKKKIVMVLIAISLVATLSFFVSAAAGCCEKTTSGVWCQSVEKSECASGFSWAQTSCNDATFCRSGTCVNENSGTCTQNVPKSLCELEEGGVWHNKAKDEILECRPGCCILGQEVAFVNQASCKQLATDYGVNVNFRSDITSQQECIALDTTIDEGACIFESEDGTDCKRTTQSECSQLGGNFKKGLLCTATGLSDCAKSKETVCKDDKVYFKDTCENLANVYDEDLFDDANYWEEIQNPECSVGGVPSSTCGDCSYRLGTICAEHKNGAPGMPNNAPQYGDNVCRDLACFYDTNNDGNFANNEKYQHGESWCAESEGTYPHIPLFIDGETKDELRKGYNQYNLPGSRYYKLKCYNGEVIVEPCKQFRNDICKETIDANTDKRVSACFSNEDVNCLLVADTKSSCEDLSGCKWVPGYRIDGTVIGDDPEYDGTKLEEYNERQGGCYPLFTPGITFWDAAGSDHCVKTGGVVERALFEIGSLGSRQNFAEDDVKTAAKKCIDGCYAIPGYGSTDGTNYGDPEVIKKFQLGTGKLPEKLYISKREGYYCKKEADEPDTIDNTKTGSEDISSIDCTSGSDDSKDLERRRVKPFYTHKQWIEALEERSRSIGDCGYKPHAFSENIFTENGKKSGTGWLGDPLSEKLTVIFEKLKQSKESKGTVGERKTLYTGTQINTGIPISGYRNA